MKKISFLLLFVTLTGCSKSGPGLAAYWLSWSDEMLIQWQVKSSILSSNATAYCSGNLELPELQSEWKELAIHWASLNGFPYLAVADNNLEFDLYFWPDKRNLIERRLSQRIESGLALETDEMASTIAGEKGLTALEWLLFNESLSTEQRCLSLGSVAGYYSQQVDSIVQYHEKNPIIQAEWLEDKNSTEGASISLNLSFQQIAQMSNRLRNGLDEQGQLIPILSEGWRSNLSKDIYVASYASVIQHLERASERLDITVNSKGLLDFQINDMKELAIQLETSIEIDPDVMLKIKISLTDAEQFIEGPLAQDTGVLIGFNNYDGD